jgi:hypothetical protein
VIARIDKSCSETTLTGESRFYISTPLGIEPGSLRMTGSTGLTHWTSETVCECRLSYVIPEHSGESAEYSKERTARAVQQGQYSQARPPGQDCQESSDGIARTGQLRWTARTVRRQNRLARKESQGRTARTGQPEMNSQEGTAKK